MPGPPPPIPPRRTGSQSSASAAPSRSPSISDSPPPPPPPPGGLLIGVTGAEGELGRLLVPMLKSHPSIRVRGFRKEAGERLPHCDEEIVWDLTSPAAASAYLAGCRVVVHLAALPKPWESWERIYENNLKIDNVLFAAAAEADSVKRVVYASTNHVQHGATMRGTPETLDGDRYGAHVAGYRLMTPDDPPAPDSFYAASKLHGEGLGRLYARLHGLEVVALRIGWVVKEPNPLESKWVATPENREYMRAMNLSHGDCRSIFLLAAAAPPSELGLEQRFGLCYACSRNARRVFDLSCTERVLGYLPSDDVEDFFSSEEGEEEEAEAAEAEAEAVEPQEQEVQGGVSQERANISSGVGVGVGGGVGGGGGGGGYNFLSEASIDVQRAHMAIRNAAAEAAAEAEAHAGGLGSNAGGNVGANEDEEDDDGEDDFFGDDDDDDGGGGDGMQAAEQRSVEERNYNMGFQEAIDEGKEASLQQGFDQGFREGFAKVFDLSTREALEEQLRAKWPHFPERDLSELVEEILEASKPPPPHWELPGNSPASPASSASFSYSTNSSDVSSDCSSVGTRGSAASVSGSTTTAPTAATAAAAAATPAPHRAIRNAAAAAAMAVAAEAAEAAAGLGEGASAAGRPKQTMTPRTPEYD